jgi:anti-sigma28 factor (negative regulator of flagellin synthesis)
MKVHPSRETTVSTPRSTGAKPYTRSSDADAPNFVATNKLAQQLAATPTGRADKVARAKALIADPNYPGDKTIRAVARKLAEKILPIPDVNKAG